MIDDIEMVRKALARDVESDWFLAASEALDRIASELELTRANPFWVEGMRCNQCSKPAHRGACDCSDLASARSELLATQEHSRNLVIQNVAMRRAFDAELASAQEAVRRAEWHVSDYDAGDSAALHELRAVIDDGIGWRDGAQQEAGDYLARLHEIAAELASARAQAELTDAERWVVRSASIAVTSMTPSGVRFRDLRSAVAALLALRAREKAE